MDMRHWIDIVEQPATSPGTGLVRLHAAPCGPLNETLLYRGDVTHIDRFDIAKTDSRGLFGPGIYLTDDPVIANDYTVARGDTVVFPKLRGDHDENRTTKELLKNYVWSLASQFDEAAFKDAWCRKNGYGDRYNGLPSGAHRQLDADMEQAKRRSIHDRWADAVAAVQKDLPNLKVVKQTTGFLKLVRRDHAPAISVFDVPEDYLARTLHADRPLPDDALAAIRDLWVRAYPRDDIEVFRDRNNDSVRGGFDAAIEHFRRHGASYAWRDEDGDIGGRGQNPSLDEIMNGTHNGHYVFYDGMFDTDRPRSTALIAALMKAGYTGLEYDGGLRVGAHVRGGGGRRHRAFVLWDMDALHGFRLPNAQVPPPKGIRKTSVPSPALG